MLCNHELLSVLALDVDMLHSEAHLVRLEVGGLRWVLEKFCLEDES